MLFAIRELHFTNKSVIWEIPIIQIMLLYRQHIENLGGNAGIDIATKDMIDEGLI